MLRSPCRAQATPPLSNQPKSQGSSKPSDMPPSTSDENPKTAQIQGPMTRSMTKQSVDTLQQMVVGILNKVQVEKDEGPSGGTTKTINCY